MPAHANRNRARPVDAGPDDRLPPDAPGYRLDPFARRKILEQRLEDGYRRIEDARLNQLDVRAWEDFWIQLLRDYERVCDELGTLAA